VPDHESEPEPAMTDERWTRLEALIFSYFPEGNPDAGSTQAEDS
jgi:hypothetical protein